MPNITGHTELVGLMAYPIRHTQSPTTHNLAYDKNGDATQLLLCRRAPDPDSGACVDRLPPVPYRHTGDGDFCGAGSDAGSKHDGDSCREIWRG